MRKLLVVAIIFGAISGCSDAGPWDGPAGTKMGISKSQVEKYAVLELMGESKSGSKMYSSKQAPSMSSGADTYEYVFSPDDKLCLVQLRINKVRKSTSSIMLDLKNKYGSPIKDPAVSWGVIWGSEKYKLHDNLIEIAVEFLGEEPNVSAEIGYTFSNISDCKQKS